MRIVRVGLVFPVHTVEWEDLGRSDVGNGEDFRTCHRFVIVLGSAIQHGTPLNLIIATCLMFRHLKTLEKPDDPWPFPILNKPLES